MKHAVALAFGFLVLAALAGPAQAQSVTITTVIPDWTKDQPLQGQDPTGTVTVSGVPLVAVGFSTSYSWSVTSGSLPTGLSLGTVTVPLLGSYPALIGTPTTTGTWNFSLQAVGNFGGSATQSFQMVISPRPAIQTTELPVARAGKPYSASITTVGGTGAVGVVVLPGSGSPPPGILFNPLTNTFTGTPTAEGESGFTLRATDLVGATGDQALVIRVLGPVSLALSGTPRVPVGEPLELVVTASGGEPPYVFEDPAGMPAPLGARLDGGSRIVVEGTPTGAGRFPLTFRVADSLGEVAELEIELVVYEPIVLADADLGFALLGEPFAAGLPLEGGIVPFTVSLKSGSLPEGLAFDGAGVAGTPAEAGFFPFTARIRDSLGTEETADYELCVARRLAASSKFPATGLPVGGRIAFALDLIEGTTLTLKAKVKSGAELVSVSLVTREGLPVDLVPYGKAGKKKLSFKNVPIPRTERFFLVFTSTGAAGAEVSGKLKAKAPKGGKVLVTFGPTSGELSFPFSFLAGSKLRIDAKSKGGDVPAADLVEFLRPDGTPVDVGPLTKARKGGFRITKLTTATGGDFVLRIRPAATGSATGSLQLAVKVRPPKVYAFTVE